MRILKTLLLGLVLLLAVVWVVGLFLPDSAHVERSISIKARPEIVFDLIDDFESFNRWSPWARKDPRTQYSFTGPESGVGAMMSWHSENPGVGTGSQQIIVVEPLRRVVVELDFDAQGMATAYYEIQPENTGTRVTWGFDTDFGNDLLGRYLGLFLDILVGADYEAGLANLKELAEKRASETTRPASRRSGP